MCKELMLVDCSLGARPAQGAATTVDIRCLSSLADTETVSLLLRKATKGHAPQWVCVSVIFVCSLGARPAQGAATTVDIRCLSSLADARTSVPTVRMCGELMLVDCSLVRAPGWAPADPRQQPLSVVTVYVSAPKGLTSP